MESAALPAMVLEESGAPPVWVGARESGWHSAITRANHTDTLAPLCPVVHHVPMDNRLKCRHVLVLSGNSRIQLLNSMLFLIVVKSDRTDQNCTFDDILRIHA